MNRFQSIARCGLGQALVGLAVTTASPARELANVPLPTTGRNPMVEVTIDGHGPLRLMVDPGNESLVPEDFATKLGLVKGDDGTVLLTDVVIGGVNLGDVSAMTWTPERISPGGRTPDGYLAVSAFSDYLLTLDYSTERLVIETGELPEADGRTTLDYHLTEDGALAVPVEIAGLSVDARLDAGAIGDFTLPVEYVDKLPLFRKPDRIGRTETTDGRKVDILGARLDGAAHLGSHEYRKPGIDFSEAFPEPMIGFGGLAHFAITFDQANQRIRFRANADHAAFQEEKAGRILALEPEDPSLKTFFNANSEKVHLMVLLSPT